MAPTIICSEKQTKLRSGITEIRKQSNTTSLSTSPSSSLNYAQKRKQIRPYPVRGKRPFFVDNSVNQISSSSDTSNDTNERFHSHSLLPSISSSISDNSISTSSESSLLTPVSLSSFTSTLVSDDDYTPCAGRLKPFYHICCDLSSVYSISSSDEEKHLDDDIFSRSFSMITSDSQDKVTSTIDDDKSNFRYLSKLQMQQETKHTKGLFEVAIKMIKLVHRNQLLQRRLAQLQAETSQFIQSVLANPENQAFRDKVQTNGC